MFELQKQKYYGIPGYCINILGIKWSYHCVVPHLFLYFGLTCSLQWFVELKARRKPKPTKWSFGSIGWHKSCITLSAFLIQSETGRWEGKKVCALGKKCGPRSLGQTVKPPSQRMAGSTLNMQENSMLGVAQTSCAPPQIPLCGRASFCPIPTTGHSVICTKPRHTISLCNYRGQ